MRGLLSPSLPQSPRSSWVPAEVRERRHRRVLPIVGVALCLLILLHTILPSAAPPTAGSGERTGTRWTRLFSFGSRRVPRATLAADLSFSDYLDAHFPHPKTRPQPHLWITLADSLFARTGAANLHAFVQQLNDERRAKYGKRTRETRVITLCLDEACVDECARRGMYAYGGFERQRPEQILRATWPKLASLIEGLPRRDLFFVDADVSLSQDPYPHMEPLMDRFDILAQENDAFEHFNTGWLWMRKGQVVADAWAKVLAMDMENVSRDQFNFNSVLGTGPLRAHPGEEDDPYRRPLENEFVAQNGLRVHVLNQRMFRVYHQRDVTYVSRHDSTLLHMTCADDAWVKLFVAKVEGFWGDVDGYYSSPPQLLSINHLTGPKENLVQLFRILLSLAHYSSRALSLPSHATILDMASSPLHETHSTFPLSHLAAPGADSPLNVTVVEPAYVEHATAWLLGRSVLRDGERRADGWWEALGEEERTRRMDKAMDLTKVYDLDMRQHDTFASLLKRLVSDPLFAAASHVRLVHFDWPGYQQWTSWELPGAVAHVQTCARIEEGTRCGELCRFDGEERIRVDEPWRPLADVIGA
ncbi:hypothetical protein JCM3770_001651 [Rhodotorula araucariae]